jgi:hypothetical protein
VKANIFVNPIINFLNYGLQCLTKKGSKNKKWLELNCLSQGGLRVPVDINFGGEKISIKNNAEMFLHVGKEMYLEIIIDTTEYMSMTKTKMTKS